MDRIEKLKNMLVNNPADEFLQHALALEHVKTGDDITAEQLFTKILETNPDYTGSYYHLARLYERQHNAAAAIKVYERGMEACKKNKEMHNLSELRAAYEELTMD